MKKTAVYLGACPEYNPERIASIIREAVKRIGLPKPVRGRVVIKPNLVMAHPKVATEAYTRGEAVEGMLIVLKDWNDAIDKVDIVEKSGLGVSTASMFRWAGYPSVAKRYGARLRAMEEIPHKTVVLQNGKVHRHISVAREMAERDFLIFMPKLKTNVLSHGYSGALKLNIGNVDSKERLYHHHRDLPVKIVDILEAANPDLIVTDGVRFAFGGNQMTQKGTDFGVIAVSTNAVAHDMVCAKMLGLDPFKIEHIREAIERGYGPRSFQSIEVLGDFPVRKGVSIAGKLDFGFHPVQDFPCRFRIQSGEPLCIGGCQGVFLDWLHMVKDRLPGQLDRFPKMTVLVGRVEKAVNDKTVLLIGDCAKASPRVSARRVARIPGCPPTHKRIVLTMMLRFFLIAPLVRPSLIVDSFVLYPVKKIKGWLLNSSFRQERS
jgi:uncharacterized protein (DUF362 family)